MKGAKNEEHRRAISPRVSCRLCSGWLFSKAHGLLEHLTGTLLSESWSAQSWGLIDKVRESAFVVRYNEGIIVSFPKSYWSGNFQVPQLVVVVEVRILMKGLLCSIDSCLSLFLSDWNYWTNSHIASYCRRRYQIRNSAWSLLRSYISLRDPRYSSFTQVLYILTRLKRDGKTTTIHQSFSEEYVYTTENI